MWDWNSNGPKKWHPGLNGNKWSDCEIAYLIKCGNNLSLNELSVALKRSRYSVAKKRHSLGLEKLKGYKAWEEDEINFLKSNAGSMALTDIAKTLGRSLKSVQGKATYMKLSLLRIGEKHSAAIYSDEDVLLCRELHSAGMGLKLIAEKMEMSPGAVKWVIHGHRMTQQDRIMFELDRMDARR
ncbi:MULTISPECIES: hypothetical protein [Klebsiella/Raoultella group]|uniref:hypothetical protein n=1 Tax=Klebsiella/Raoultella group TaxID=2890311 RepID=UPI0006606C68|nr:MULTISPECIES: hypothetical protein [Klebsiella/Raoultella group]HCF7917549.1 hypothetical protein [Klebsiella pneumoniae]